MTAEEHFAEAIKITKGHPGFTIWQDSIRYNAMGCDIFSVSIDRSLLKIYDRRYGSGNHFRWPTIETVLRYFADRPHRFSAQRVYETSAATYFIAPGMCIKQSDGPEIMWDGDRVDIEGETITYAFERATEILARHENSHTRAMCELEPIIRGHPDFYITHNFIHVQDRVRNGIT
jgi:hypothetical protein